MLATLVVVFVVRLEVLAVLGGGGSSSLARARLGSRTALMLNRHFAPDLERRKKNKVSVTSEFYIWLLRAK